jgi:alkylhydroperoxidase family enzyme
MARVTLRTPADVSEEHRAFVEAMDARGGFINLYRAMAHSEGGFRQFYELLACLWAGALTARTREVAILSVVSASNAPYPLAWHVLDAAEAGLTTPEIRAVVDNNIDALPPEDAAIVRFSRELTLDAAISDPTFAAAALPDERAVVELTMIAALYRMVACVSNALQIEIDTAAAPAIDGLRETP